MARESDDEGIPPLPSEVSRPGLLKYGLAGGATGTVRGQTRGAGEGWTGVGSSLGVCEMRWRGRSKAAVTRSPQARSHGAQR